MTPRESEILLLVAEGLTDREIGTRLFISHRTVGHHVSSLLAKLGATRRSELAAVAHRSGLVNGSAVEGQGERSEGAGERSGLVG
jgi:DNA-binding NarL/FixJ family response regulator